MIRTLRSDRAYVKVFRDRMTLENLEVGGRPYEVLPVQPFTTRRLLVGLFDVAEHCLQKGLKRLGKNGWLKPGPQLIVQPMEMTDGGLSQVEERVIMEMAHGAGAKRVLLWVGGELSRQEALNKLVAL